MPSFCSTDLENFCCSKRYLELQIALASFSLCCCHFPVLLWHAGPFEVWLALSDGIQPVLNVHHHVAQVAVLQQGLVLATEWAADQLKTQGVREDDYELGDKPVSQNHCSIGPGHG